MTFLLKNDLNKVFNSTLWSKKPSHLLEVFSTKAICRGSCLKRQKKKVCTKRSINCALHLSWFKMQIPPNDKTFRVKMCLIITKYLFLTTFSSYFSIQRDLFVSVKVLFFSPYSDEVIFPLHPCLNMQESTCSNTTMHATPVHQSFWSAPV